MGEERNLEKVIEPEWANDFKSQIADHKEGELYFVSRNKILEYLSQFIGVKVLERVYEDEDGWVDEGPTFQDKIVNPLYLKARGKKYAKYKNKHKSLPFDIIIYKHVDDWGSGPKDCLIAIILEPDQALPRELL